MFINVTISEPKEIIIEKPQENHYKSDMIADNTTRIIKIKGKAMVEARPQTYDDRFSGRLNPNDKYDVVIVLRTDYLGQKGIESLKIKEEK